MAVMGYWGHTGAAAAIFALVISTAFLIWVSTKMESPYLKFGKVIGWIAIVLSLLLVLGQIYTCFTYSYGGEWCKHAWKGPKSMMGPGMHRGMGPMTMPPAPPTPENP